MRLNIGLIRIGRGAARSYKADVDIGFDKERYGYRIDIIIL